MKFIKKYSLLISCLALFLMSGVSFANTEQMNATLARISRLLNQVNPLINLAEKQQDPNARVKFQFDGLRYDVAKIQSGIAQAINRVSIQSRVIKPLSGDYLPMSESVLKKQPSLNSEDSTP
ncbi:MAG: RAQPRD family integrative conjugative element protein [Legionellales bacterium]|nr:RAQPRD family integrative conjugative element protein [Legionellales bacterium]